jgi:hypothetical protein
MFYTLDCLNEWERRKKEIEFAQKQNLAKHVTGHDSNSQRFLEACLVKLGQVLESWGRRLQARFAPKSGQLSY